MGFVSDGQVQVNLCKQNLQVMTFGKWHPDKVTGTIHIMHLPRHVAGKER